MGLIQKTKITLEMIKWEHSIFALPFALTATILAANGLPSIKTLLWILVAMITARSAAMAFNRYADAELDGENPRTRSRAIPAGLLSKGFVLGFTLLMIALFLVACWQLNRLTLILAPVALIVLLGYSFMKRLTRWSHLVLGLALGIAPSAAWIAVRGTLDARIILLTIAVMLWVGGFDVLYACQDYEHDSEAGLFSLPQSLGLVRAFLFARIMHLIMMLLVIAFGILFHFGWPAWTAVIAVGALLLYEHSLVSPKNLTRLNAAFFTMNGIIAMIFFAGVALDLWLKKY